MTTKVIVLLMCGAASVACAQGKPAASAAGPSAAAAAKPTPPADASQWLTYDPATSTATLKLVAGAPGAKSPFNFDGYTDGGAALVVPPKTKVVINFVNEDGTPHSAEVIADKDPMPNIGGDPAIPAAYTKDVTQGLPQFGKDVISFTAPDQGSYRIFCGVPGHGLSGMWIRFTVDPAAKTASFGPTKR